MSYTKPQVLSQNKANGSYAAGCPSNYLGTDYNCRHCDRAK